MVSYALIVASLAALTTSMFQVFKPRLPPYSLQIIKIPVPSIIGGEVMTRISAKVRLHNDNFIGIDVHSLVIDMFYPDWSGELTHIGRVYDRKIQHSTQECLADSACRKEKGLDLPVWALQPRADFQITDNVFALMKPSGLLKTIAGIVWNSIKGGGLLVIPTTGVMQVKASSSTPVTMSMICDNSLNLWTLVMVGVECSLNSLDIGWLGIDGTIDKLQLEVLSTLQANTTGGVLESHRPRGIGKKHGNFEKALKEVNSSSLRKD